MNKAKIIYDLVGIGLGPFNLGLAALSQPIHDLKTIFFEKNTKFDWHPGMLIDGASLQVPFMADLVTLANPSSPFSFLAYLHQHRRIYKFYFLEKFHISRHEYNHYCQWASSQMSNLMFGHCVMNVEHIDAQPSLLKISVMNMNNGKLEDYYAKNIVLGIGTSPSIPQKLSSFKHDCVQHSANFINFNHNILKTAQTISIIGSGQSAAEIVLELLNEHERHPRKLLWATRASGFFPMEYSKLGLEHFSPEYMQYFYHLNPETKQQALQQQDLMYKGISHKTISDIFDKLYQLTIANQLQPLELIAHSELENISESDKTSDSKLLLDFTHTQLKNKFQRNCDAVVLATGYRCTQPSFLQPLHHLLELNQYESYALNEDFSIKLKQPLTHDIFIQNNSMHTHGIGSPDLGLGCYRNSIILNKIAKRECYPIHTQNVFQTFNITALKSGQLHDYDRR